MKAAEAEKRAKHKAKLDKYNAKKPDPELRFSNLNYDEINRVLSSADDRFFEGCLLFCY